MHDNGDVRSAHGSCKDAGRLHGDDILLCCSFFVSQPLCTVRARTAESKALRGSGTHQHDAGDRAEHTVPCGLRHGNTGIRDVSDNRRRGGDGHTDIQRKTVAASGGPHGKHPGQKDASVQRAADPYDDVLVDHERFGQIYDKLFHRCGGERYICCGVQDTDDTVDTLRSVHGGMEHIGDLRDTERRVCAREVLYKSMGLVHRSDVHLSIVHNGGITGTDKAAGG